MFKDKALPLYYQLETVLRKKILSGELPPRVSLPTQELLAEEYQVSRITVREALSSLERDGLIECKRGKAATVLESLPSVKFPRLTGSMSDIIARGAEIHTKVLDFGLTNVSKDITDSLGIAPRTPVTRIERLRLVKKSPLSYVLNYLPQDIGQKIRHEDLLSKPLLRILNDDLGIEFSRAAQRIEADIADAQIASLLGIRVGEPLLKIHRVTFDNRQRAVECVTVWYRADRYFYTVELDGKTG